MALQSKGTIYAVAKEVTFNTAPTFVDADVMEMTTDTSLSPSVDSIERKAVSNSFISAPSIAVKEYGSGSISVELIPENTGTDMNGDVILDVALGIKEDPALGTGAFIGYSDAGVTPANMIYEADVADTGTATLYKLAKPTTTPQSLAVQQFVGGSGDDVVTYTGVVPNSVTIAIPTADIATISFDVGAAGFATSTGETPLVGTALTESPYVGKNATFTIDGTEYCATDVSLTISNTVTDVECLTTQGIGEKVVVSKAVTGSMSFTFEDFSELDKLKNNTDGELYVEMTSGAHQFAIYLPKIRYTSVDVGDTDGLVTNSIEFAAFNDDTTGEAILVAHL